MDEESSIRPVVEMAGAREVGKPDVLTSHGSDPEMHSAGKNGANED